jgi:hypothetical protein
MESLSAVAWHRPALGHRNRVALFPPMIRLPALLRRQWCEQSYEVLWIVSWQGIHQYRIRRVLEKLWRCLLSSFSFFTVFINMTEFA